MQITFAEFIAAFGVSVTLLGIFSTIIYNLWRRITALSDDIGKYKLHVAENYASVKHIAGMETKLIASEERMLGELRALTARIDRLITKMDRDI